MNILLEKSTHMYYIYMMATILQTLHTSNTHCMNQKSAQKIDWVKPMKNIKWERLVYSAWEKEHPKKAEAFNSSDETSISIETFMYAPQHDINEMPQSHHQLYFAIDTHLSNSFCYDRFHKIDLSKYTKCTITPPGYGGTTLYTFSSFYTKKNASV